MVSIWRRQPSGRLRSFNLIPPLSPASVISAGFWEIFGVTYLSVRLDTASRVSLALKAEASAAVTMKTATKLRTAVLIISLLSMRHFSRSQLGVFAKPLERWYTHPGHALPILVDEHLRPNVLLHLAHGALVDESLMGEDKLTFSLPTPSPTGLSVGSLLDLAGRIYRVMIINEREDDSGLRTIEIEAWARWYDLARMPELPARRWANSTPEPIVSWFLDEESGWRIGNAVVSARRDFVWKGGVDRLSALREIERVFNAEIVWDTMRRTVSLVQAGGDDAGVFFLRGKNLRKAQIETSGTDLVHRLYPYGSQGTTIAPVNAGVPYLEVPSNYSPPPSAILVASDLSDPQQLKEHAQALFSTINVPQVNYTCGIVDLSTLPGFEQERVLLGDIVTVYDEFAEIHIKTRVVRIRYNVEEPWNSDIELASLRRDTSDFMRDIRLAVTEDVFRDDRGNLVTNARVTDYTLTMADGGGVIVTMESGVTTLLRVPAHSETPIPIGAKIYVQRLGSGMVAIYPEPGVVLQAADDAWSLRTKFSTAWLLRRFADTWTLSGDLKPVAFVASSFDTPSRLSGDLIVAIFAIACLTTSSRISGNLIARTFARARLVTPSQLRAVIQAAETVTQYVYSCDYLENFFFRHHHITLANIGIALFMVWNPTGVSADSANVYSCYFDVLHKHNRNTFAVTQTVTAPKTLTFGIGADNVNVYSCDSDWSELFRHDRTTLGVTQTVSAPGVNTSGIASDGVDLYSCDFGTDLIYRLNRTTFAVTQTVASPLDTPSGMGSNGVDVFSCNYTVGRLFRHARNILAVVQTVNAPYNQPKGICGDLLQ